MAGIIEQQLPPGVSTAPPEPQQTMAAVPPPAEDEMDDDDVEVDESDPNYQAALKFVKRALYENKAVEGIATRISKSPDKVKALAENAYEIVTVAVEKLEGALPEELYLLLAAEVLNELNDVAEAIGVEFTETDIAGALRQMLTRYLQEMGQDTTQLEAAMDQLPPDIFSKLAKGGE